MFTPAVPIGGYAGFKIFERSQERQFSAFSRAPDIQREVAYFREKSAEVNSVSDFVGDRRLLSVALGAFGLEAELPKRAIIRRILEEPPGDPRSFINRLNDPRWRAFAQSFSFSNGSPRFSNASFQDTIASRYVERSFERAVGEVDPNVRLALNFRREIRAIAESPDAGRVGWFQILAQQPLRRVVETAFGLPQSLARLDVARQREILEEKAAAFLGSRSPAAFVDPATVEATLRRFFLSQSAEQGVPQTTPGAAALAVLSGLQLQRS
jgi:hypothetical protein